MRTPDEQMKVFESELEQLSVEQLTEASQWMQAALKPSKTEKVGSYGEKHEIQRLTGLYLTHGQFTALAKRLGFTVSAGDRPNRDGTTNWDVWAERVGPRTWGTVR